MLFHELSGHVHYLPWMGETRDLSSAGFPACSSLPKPGGRKKGLVVSCFSLSFLFRSPSRSIQSVFYVCKAQNRPLLLLFMSKAQLAFQEGHFLLMLNVKSTTEAAVSSSLFHYIENIELITTIQQ